MAVVQLRPFLADDIVTPIQAVNPAMKRYLDELEQFIDDIDGDSYGYQSRIFRALQKAKEDAADAPVAFLAKLGRQARRELEAALSFIRSARSAAVDAIPSIGIQDLASAASSMADNIVRSSVTTIGKTVAGSEAATGEATSIVRQAIASIGAAETAIESCRSDYDGPPALRLVANPEMAAQVQAVTNMLAQSIRANARPMIYARTQLESLISTAQYDKIDAFIAALSGVIVETLGTPQPVLAARQGQAGIRDPQGMSEHGVANQLQHMIAAYRRDRMPSVLMDGPTALDAIKVLFNLACGTSPVWMSRGTRTGAYASANMIEAAGGWAKVDPAWTMRWIVPLGPTMRLPDWQAWIDRLLTPPGKRLRFVPAPSLRGGAIK
jgi:hypothetical protein